MQIGTAADICMHAGDVGAGHVAASTSGAATAGRSSTAVHHEWGASMPAAVLHASGRGALHPATADSEADAEPPGTSPDTALGTSAGDPLELTALSHAFVLPPREGVASSAAARRQWPVYSDECVEEGGVLGHGEVGEVYQGR